MILIVIIVVALIGLTYTFAANLFSTTTETATSSVTTTTKNMDKTVQIIGVPTCGVIAGQGITTTFTIKHGGATFAINTERKPELTVMFGSTVLPNANVTLSAGAGVGCINCIGNVTINPQEMKTFNLTYGNSSALITATQKLYIVSPAGEISETLTCAT